jgi:hypothetical protein
MQSLSACLKFPQDVLLMAFQDSLVDKHLNQSSQLEIIAGGQMSLT